MLAFRLYQELGATGEAGADAGSGVGARPAMLVETEVVQPRSFDASLEILGELRAVASVEVMSRISGRLEAVLVFRGDRVKRGQLLAVVEDTDLQQQIRRSEASIRVAKAASRREQATVDNLRLQLKRIQSLYDENLVSLQDLQDMQSRVRVAESQHELTEAQVQQAEAALRELKIQQEQTRIHSPLDGFVSERHLEPGALVSPSVPIVSVLNLDRVKTVVPVPERTLEALRVGLASKISVDAYPGKTYQGAVTRISPFLNPETRSADIEIEIPNPGQLLRPGMFARVQIDVKTRQDLLAVPRTGLLTRGSQKGVYLLSSEMKTVFRPVTVGRIQGEYVEILDGLEAGTVIVTKGAQNLNEGDTVQVAPQQGAVAEIAPAA